MAQLRKDPFGSTWVIISPERGLAPSDFGSVYPQTDQSILSPGQEHRLGRELRALRPVSSSVNAPDWQARVVEADNSLFEAKPFMPSGDALFHCAASSGSQELIIEHPDARMSLERMPLPHLCEIIKLYRERLEILAGKPDVAHIQLTRNVGRVAGAMYDHPHAQLLAMPVPNRWVDEELQAATTYFDQYGQCLFCDVIQAELAKRDRLVSYNRHFVALAPYASKTPFEVWILPRQHSSSFTDLASNTIRDLAELLQDIIWAMNTALNYPPYNMILHTLPNVGDSRYHWHIELLPRLTRQAGFDWGTGFYINPTPPEDATRFLREALALQGVEL